MRKITKLMLTLVLLAVGVGAKAEEGTKTPLLLLKNGVINTTDFDVTPIAPSTLTTDNLYAATFTSKGGYCNTFKYENLDVSDYDKAVIKFGEAIADADAWQINLPSGSFTALSAGITEYEVSLDGVTTYGDFTIFSWNHSGKSITISECYLFKSNEPATPVDRWLVYDGEAKTNSWDKQAIYDFPTGIAMEQGKTYIVKADIKSANGGACALWPIDNDSENKNEWGGSNDVQYCASYTTTTSLVTYIWEFTATYPHDRLQFVFGQLDGKIYFDNVSCMEKGTTTEMVVNGDFSVNSTTGWSANWNGPTFALEEVPSDPLATDKEVLAAKIALAKMYNSLAYTDASFADLTTAISDAETALDAEDATAESLAAAKDNVQAKIDALAFKDGYKNLTEDMMYSWTGWGAEAVKGSNSGNYAYNLFVSTDQPYGDPSVNAWADLAGYQKLILISTGTPRFLFNRDADNGQWSETESESHLIDNTVGSANSWHAKYFSQEGNVYTVDLAQLYADKGFARLNAIKARSNITVSGMYLYDPLASSKDALKEKIADASRYSSDYYSATSYEALQTAIAAAEAAIVAADATAESLTAAGEALDAAVAGLQINKGYRELVAEDFFQWDAVQNPTSREAANGAYEIGTATQMPYGDPSVSEFKYANLKQYDKLIVTVTAGTPRFMFNRDVAGGNWNATESESHLIEYPKDGWSSKYFSNEGNTYIVDLKQLVADKGIANLNAIKGANWQDVTITGMYLYKEDAPDTYGIIGPLVGGWDDSDEKEMTESLMGIYTYTFPDEFHATEASYAYKLRANKVWGGYELPASGQPDKTWTPAEVGGYYNLTIKADVLTNSLEVEAVPVTVAHTATFTTNLDWDDVYAFVWTEGKKNFLGDWPGTKLEAAEGVYTVNFESTKGGVAPEQIIFNNGKEGDEKEQTSDLAYEDNKAYTWNLNYYVMSEDFFGSWDASEAGKMTKNADGTYTLNMENQVLSANTNKEYKVMKDLGGNTTWYPDGDNKKIEIKMDATYDIAITINPSDNSISEAMSVYKIVSAAGYATYCAPYALNFDGTGVKAYFAKKENGNNVKFYEISNAPANTGLLLKADAGTYKLKMEAVTGDAAANVDGNVLIGVNEQTVVDKSGIYVLRNEDQGVGFYKTTAASFTVGANTAYIDAIAGARSFIGFDFDDNTTTAIEGIAAEKAGNGEVFNLQGQRVAKAQKGLYIVDGKKVLVK